jgi:RNA polymerase sigma-70 factor (ECF subfamily)
MPEPETDESLMAAYVAGDRRAFERLFARVAPKIHAFFRRSFRDPAVADELMQTTFLKVHRARATYRPELPVRPWLFTIAAHVRRDEWRKRYRLAEDAGDEAIAAAEQVRAVESASDAVEARDRAQIVQAALESLPEMQRVILQLHRYEGMTHVEIAELLGSTPGAVRQHAFRAYEDLRKRLKTLLADPEPAERRPA